RNKQKHNEKRKQTRHKETPNERWLRKDGDRETFAIMKAAEVRWIQFEAIRHAECRAIATTSNFSCCTGCCTGCCIQGRDCSFVDTARFSKNVGCMCMFIQKRAQR